MTNLQIQNYQNEIAKLETERKHTTRNNGNQQDMSGNVLKLLKKGNKMRCEYKHKHKKTMMLAMTQTLIHHTLQRWS